MARTKPAGDMLIGDFRHARSPDATSVSVVMRWGPEGQRIGRLVVPAVVEKRLNALDYPALGEDMGMEAALSYAVFVAMRLGLDLLLAGDSSVWDASWGRLDPVDRPSGEMTRSAVVIN